MTDLRPRPAVRAPSVQALVRYRPLVRRACRELARDRNDADEIEQLTWLKVLRHPPRHGRSIPTWLLRVARNVAVSRAEAEEARRIRERIPRPSAYPKSPPQTLADEQRDRALHRALAGLGARKREALRLRYLEGWPPRRIAALEGLPVETVRTRIKRGLEELRASGALDSHAAETVADPCCPACAGHAP